MKKEINNVSFIVIFRNEELALSKCLGSISMLNKKNCEVVCIDSGSTDNSLSIVKKYIGIISELRIFSIKGYSNSAITRNVGIKCSSKKYLYFVDGDVELSEGFILKAIDKFREMEVEAITGDLEEYQYSIDGKKILKKIQSRFHKKNEKYIRVSGGCFIAKKSAINNVGYFDETFERGQDNEYTLRFTKSYKMLSIPLSMGVHHTIPYEEYGRLWNSIKKNYPKYIGMILRRNILNCQGLYDYCLGPSKGILFGALEMILFVFIFMTIPPPYSLIIAVSIFAMDILFGVVKKKNILYRITIHYLYPIFVIIGFFSRSAKGNYSVMEII